MKTPASHYAGALWKSPADGQSRGTDLCINSSRLDHFLDSIFNIQRDLVAVGLANIGNAQGFVIDRVNCEYAHPFKFVAVEDNFVNVAQANGDWPGTLE